MGGTISKKHGEMTLAPNKTLLILFLACAYRTTMLPAQSSGQVQLRQAVSTFGQAQYDQSLRLFRNIILDSSLDLYHGDSYFWIAKSYMALRQYENASKNLEFFLSEYPGHLHFPEGLYQRGRLVFLQGEYEGAIQILEGFITEYPNSSFAANSYYWIGESLYTLGHFDKALKIFDIVVTDFPTSFKVEAAKYRISLIELKERERELLKLLKWSHEEYLGALEEFDRKERSYEQALNAYQRTIREFEAGNTVDPKIDLSEKQVTSPSEAEVPLELSDDNESSAVESAAPTSAFEADLLQLKETALELKSFYLLWLSAIR